MSDEFVLCDIKDGVALVTLNRPERLNAMGAVMGEQFDRIMVDVGVDDAVRAVVLTGSGKGFCAGADMDRLQGMADGERLDSFPAGTPNPAYDRLAEASVFNRSRYALPSALPKPVIAAINGACAGVGLALAVTCDVRFASAGALFTAAFPRRGLTAESGLAFTLPALIGQGAASDLLLSGRKILADEAQGMGLVNRVLEPDQLLDHAMAYARDIAQNVSPRSTRVIKRQLWMARSQSYAEAMTTAFGEVVASLASEDFREGVAHYKEKRPPRFTGR